MIVANYEGFPVNLRELTRSSYVVANMGGCQRNHEKVRV